MSIKKGSKGDDVKAMCNLDKGQRRACALKKALDAVPNDIPDKMDGDCPYYAQF